MRALFIHPTFPGPFGAQVNGLRADPKSEIFFMAEHFDNGGLRPAELDTIRCLSVAPPDCVNSPDQAERELVTTFRRSTQIASTLLRLKKEGFTPDTVCTSASSGCGLYISDIFPKARRIVYADWFYSLSALQREDGNAQSWRVRNLWCFGILSDAHCTFTSTEWQKVQFPQCIADTMHVLPQGVDTDWFAPARPVPFEFLVPELPGLKGAQEVVTVSLHSLTPEVGLPQYAHGLMQLLATRPECHVLVLDTARADFPTAAPEHYQPLFAPVLSQPQLATRLHMPGTLPRATYRNLLRAASLHVYLTTARVLSPELIEAMSCGCLVLASDAEPAREVIRHGLNGFLFPTLRGQDPTLAGEAMVKGTEILLNRSRMKDPVLDTLRAAARSAVLHRFNRAQQSEAHLRLLLA